MALAEVMARLGSWRWLSSWRAQVHGVGVPGFMAWLGSWRCWVHGVPEFMAFAKFML
jgi:hypothetical protein